MTRARASRIWLTLGGALLALLLAAVITFGSLRIPFEPQAWNQVIVLYALSTFIVAALMVFGLVLGRALVHIYRTIEKESLEIFGKRLAELEARLRPPAELEKTEFLG